MTDKAKQRRKALARSEGVSRRTAANMTAAKSRKPGRPHNYRGEALSPERKSEQLRDYLYEIWYRGRSGGRARLRDSFTRGTTPEVLFERDGQQCWMVAPSMLPSGAWVRRKVVSVRLGYGVELTPKQCQHVFWLLDRCTCGGKFVKDVHNERGGWDHCEDCGMV